MHDIIAQYKQYFDKYICIWRLSQETFAMKNTQKDDDNVFAFFSWCLQLTVYMFCPHTWACALNLKVMIKFM